MISIGVDTGLNCAFTWLDCLAPSRPEFLGTRTLDVGHRVPLAKPRRFRDGRTQTEETIVDSNDFRILYDTALALFVSVKSHGLPCIVTVEAVDKIKPRARLGKSMAMATSLNVSSRIAGEVAGAARCVFGSDVVSYEPEDVWRSAIIGKGRHEDEDKAVERVIKATVIGWPSKSNVHARDGGGIALYGARRAQLSAIGAVSL